MMYQAYILRIRQFVRLCRRIIGTPSGAIRLKLPNLKIVGPNSTPAIKKKTPDSTTRRLIFSAI
jgi:hypothetical protein